MFFMFAVMIDRKIAADTIEPRWDKIFRFRKALIPKFNEAILNYVFCIGFIFDNFLRVANQSTLLFFNGVLKPCYFFILCTHAGSFTKTTNQLGHLLIKMTKLSKIGLL